MNIANNYNHYGSLYLEHCHRNTNVAIILPLTSDFAWVCIGYTYIQNDPPPSLVKLATLSN